MDKSTLSNYGWIVIAVLVLSVMIALATPFGKYIETAVKSTTEGLFTTSQKAFNNMGLNAVLPDQEFDGTYEKPGDNDEEELIAGATFTDGTFLTWEELKLTENGAKYGYEGSRISDTTIDNGVFYGCSSLKSINIPNEITTILDSAFEKCTSLTNIDLSNTQITSIFGWTLNGCTSLTNIMLPCGMTYIGYGALYNCTALTNLNYAGSIDDWENVLLDEIWNYNVPATYVQCSDGQVPLN
jgi:hypothetical protein